MFKPKGWTGAALACGLAWALAPAVLHAGSFEGMVRFVTSRGKESMPVDYYIKGSRLRVEAKSPRGGQSVMFMDAGSREMTVLMPGQQKYMVVPLPKPGPEDKRAGRLVKTGKSAVLLGYHCDEYRYTGDRGESEIWATRSLGAFVGLHRPGMGAGQAPPRWEEDFRDKGLFPLRVVMRDESGREESRLEATKVEKKSLPSSLFKVPAGYEKMEMPGMMGMPGGLQGMSPQQRREMMERMMHQGQ